MKKYLILSSLAFLAVCAIVFIRQAPKASDPKVVAVVKALESQSASNSAVSTESRDAVKPKILPPMVTAASPEVLANARSVSSFFSASELAGLTPEQLEKLETTLAAARQATFELLLERGTQSVFPDGSVRIEIPAQGSALTDMRKYVLQSVENIVGKERVAALEQSLGTRFDANFAYFGEYPTTLDLSFGRDSQTNATRMVTMKKSYRNVSILGINAGSVSATDVLYTQTFEATYFPLAKLEPKS